MFKKLLLFTVLLLELVAPSNTYARPIHRRFTSVMSGGGANRVAAASIPYWWDGIPVGQLASTASWAEISGLTNPTVAANSGYIWAQSDGSVDLLLATNLADATNAGEWTLTGINGIDYEDLSSARVSGQSYIYLADIGNNGDTADSRGAGVDAIIYRIKEPTITGGNGTVDAGDIETIQVVYPGGSPPSHKDAEVLIVDPDNGKMYIITKREAVPGVYSITHADSLVGGIRTLVDEGNMFDIPDVASVSATGNAVGGNISPDGREILIKSYDVMYHFPRTNKATTTVMQALQATPSEIAGYVGGGSASPKKSHPSQEPQGEAVTFGYDGVDYWTASEFVAAEGSTAARYPLNRYVRATGVPVTVSFQDGVLPTAGYAGTLDTTIWDTNPNTTTYGTVDTSIVSDKAVGVETDQRKALVRWDLTPGSIPATATVIGARVDLYITAEGQGYTMHQMLVNWDELSTYNTLTAGVVPDDVEASLVEDVRNGVNLNTILNVTIRNNVFTPSYYLFPTVTCWVNGLCPNYGWIIIATDLAGGDGQQHASSEAVTATQHPKLTIRYLP